MNRRQALTALLGWAALALELAWCWQHLHAPRPHHRQDTPA